MNATSLYVSTCRLVLSVGNITQDNNTNNTDNNNINHTKWSDVYRLVPYLRQSLSCTHCDHLLRGPHTPSTSNNNNNHHNNSNSNNTTEHCQHHVCASCTNHSSKAKSNPRQVSWCSCSKLHTNYTPNNQLRILLQCYKRLCEYLLTTDMYRELVKKAESNGDGTTSGNEAPAGLLEHIREGADFNDDYESPPGLSRSAYSILPCVYTNSSTQTQSSNTTSSTEARTSTSRDSPPIKTLSNGSSLYSVLYSGTGKITIKRKAVDDSAKDDAGETTISEIINNQPNFKKPTYRSRSSASKRKGCRCGNATATPGKLTCCGQRCPCYVDSKACSECKCKGCRNPHRPNGVKVRPHIPLLDNLPILLPVKQEPMMDELDENISEETVDMSQINFEEPDIKPNINDLLTTQLEEVSASLPAAIMMDEDISPNSAQSDCDSLSPEFEVDIASPQHEITYQFSPGNLSQTDNTSDVEVEV